MRYGHGALWPFQLAPDKRLFSAPDLEAVIAYGVAGRVAIVVGDPIGPPDDAWRLFDRFLATCHQRRRVPAVYQASAEAGPALASAGFSCHAIGQEAIITLADFDLVGRPRANLRHTISRARRGGVSVQWHPTGLEPAEAARRWPRLEQMDQAWRRTAGPSMGFTIGRFHRSTLEDRPIAIATSADDEPIAFTTFLPTGVDGGWVLDLMRRVPDGVPGAVEWCIAEAALSLRSATESTLSLSLAPLAGVGGPGATGPERGLAVVARIVRPMYDVRGLARFKEKFGVRWEPRYLCVRRTRDLPIVAAALVALHLRTSA